MAQGRDLLGRDYSIVFASSGDGALTGDFTAQDRRIYYCFK